MATKPTSKNGVMIRKGKTIIPIKSLDGFLRVLTTADLPDNVRFKIGKKVKKKIRTELLSDEA